MSDEPAAVPAGEEPAAEAAAAAPAEPAAPDAAAETPAAAAAETVPTLASSLILNLGTYNSTGVSFVYIFACRKDETERDTHTHTTRGTRGGVEK